MIDYNYRMVYDCFNNRFPYDCVKHVIYLPRSLIIAHSQTKQPSVPLNHFHLSFFTSVNSLGKLTTNSEFLQVIVLNYDYPNPHHTNMSDKSFLQQGKNSILLQDQCWNHMLQNISLYCYVCSIDKRVYYCNGPSRRCSDLINFFIEHLHYMALH